MPKLNLLGEKYGRLTIIAPANNLSNGLTAWECQCDCGNKCIVATKYLRCGDTTSCGCKIKEYIPIWATEEWRKNNLDQKNVGKKFNKLTILSKTYVNKEWWAHCKCECGEEKDIRYHAVISGQIKSCGCLKIEHMKDLGSKAGLDLTGQKFGKLTVLSKTDKRAKDRGVFWHCQCDCGNFKDVKTELLKNGHVLSCGCLSMSCGELKIKELLEINNINYIQEKTFKSCAFPNTQALAKFDFYIPDKNYIIEYDGIQHFEYRYEENYYGWNNKENYLKTKERDEFKNQWCKDNNIPIIRIPYTQYNNLCLEDLLLETSHFIK